MRDYCDRHNWPVEFITGDGQKWYTQQVQKYGFGFSRSHHTNLYRYLKQHAIQRHIQTVKVGHFDRVMYLTGVRRSESTSRQNTKIVYRNGARVGVNPLIYWTDEDIDLYINTLLPDYDNPFYEIYGGSGDCYCGWTCTHRVEDFEKESPRLFNYLSTLNKTQIACGLWKYGEVPTKEQKQLVAELQNEEMPPDALCANCSIAAKTKILT